MKKASGYMYYLAVPNIVLLQIISVVQHEVWTFFKNNNKSFV